MTTADSLDTDDQRLPLAGVRVLDFSWLLPGPFCTMQLADLGAEVTKVEGPKGDYAREMLPGLFAAANRNKRSIVIDLKADGALDLVDALVRQSDVVVEGFRPGVAERLGIGAKRLREINPNVVYASLSGYGASGPLASAVGHDVNYLAQAGVLSIPGQWGEDGARSGLPIGDLAAAMSTALAIVACVMNSRLGGGGQHIEAAILPTLMNWSQVRTADYLASTPRRWPHLNPLNGVYRAQDGRDVTLAVIEPKFLERFCELAQCKHIAESDAYLGFVRDADRAAGDVLRDEIARVIRSKPSAHWTSLFEGEAVPFAPVLTPEEALAHPQLEAFRSNDVPADRLPDGCFPFPVPGLGRSDMRPAPEKGAHTTEILEAIGMTEETISQLRRDGAVQ